MAYRKIKAQGLLNNMRWAVYNALFHDGPATAKELCKDNPAIEDNGWKRLSELKDLGVVKEVGRRKCSITGQTTTVWDVTSKTPQEEVVRPPTRMQRLAKDLDKFMAYELKIGFGPRNEIMKFIRNWKG
jgi:hypothetical protein